MLESLNTDSSRELIKEFQNKLDWLENGYDLSKIINENEVKNYSKTKNKILYFVHADLPYVTSGYTIRTGAVARNLSDDILDIEVVSRWGFPLDRVDFIKRDNIVRKIIDGHGIIHNFIPSESGMREYKNYDYIEQGVKNLVSQCMEIRPSLIISASDHVTGIIGLVTSKILNIPFIYEMRGLWAYTRATNNIGYDKTFDFNLRMKLEMQCALEAQKVITISESLKNIVINWGVDESKIELLPNCIEDFELSSEVLKIDPMFVKIGYLGSIVPYEGLITTIKAIQTMKNDNKLLPKLIIAGDGSEKSRLENYIEINKLGENIELRGKIEHTEINEFYNEVDAIILPRVSTLVTDIIPPLKPLEAISRGKIILFSDIFPHRELFDKIETPFMFK
jgi:glycosyltransferase involved in cell wall biosynthesis